MSETLSEMIALGTPAPKFNLPDTNGKTISLENFSDFPALLVVFMCNHCPFVKHILESLVEFVKHYQSKGLAVVGINSNDVVMYPQDNPEQMAKLAKEADFTFPFLYDESQQTAKDYHATCTPDQPDQDRPDPGRPDPDRLDPDLLLASFLWLPVPW